MSAKGYLLGDSLRRRGPLVAVCLFLFLAFCSLSVSAQPHRAWVERYDGGNIGKPKEPVAMELDSKGNIYVVGQSGNGRNLFNYVALKYAPNGKLLWSRQFGEANGLNNIPRSIGVSTNDDLFITGTSVTVKYSSMGEELWTAPYGGRSLAVQSTNVYVTGFSETQFSTVKLDGNGHQTWLRQFIYRDGPDKGRKVVLHPDGNILVIGEAKDFQLARQPPLMAIALLKYSPGGAVVSSDVLQKASPEYQIDPVFVFFQPDRSMYMFYAAPGVAGGGYSHEFNIEYIDSIGNELWYYSEAISVTASSACIIGSNILISNKARRDQRENPGIHFGYVSANERGEVSNVIRYPPEFTIPGSAFDIRTYSKTNVLLCGWTPGIHGTDDATILMADSAGNVLWTEQYDGPSKAFDQFSKMVVDSQNNIYVTGFSENNQGGAEIFLMKYSQTSIEKKTSGNMLLQFPGEPGKQLKVEATPTLVLPDWTQIGLGLVPANGLLQVEDTNAVAFPARFYRSVTVPAL